MSHISNYVLDWIHAGGPNHDSRFSQYVRVMRVKCNLSREQLAQRMGIDPMRIVALENDLLSASDISTDAYAQLEHSFALSYQSFLTLHNREDSGGETTNLLEERL